MTTWMHLSDFHPLLAGGIAAFYVAFAVWLLARLRSWRRGRAGRRIDLDRLAARPVRRPAFALEDLARVRAHRAAGEAYRNPEDVRRAPAGIPQGGVRGAEPGSGAWSALEKVIGIVVLVLGIVFMALTAYAFLARSEARGPLGWLLSERGAEALLSTHWLMLVLTAVRVGIGMLRPRHPRVRPVPMPGV